MGPKPRSTDDTRPEADAAPSKPDASPPTDSGDETLDEESARTQAALERFVAKSNAEIHGLFEILGRKRRLLAVNFLAGISRGVGFFLGMTLVGGLIVGLLALFVDWTMSVLRVEDVTFRSLMEMVARQAVVAQEVWEDVRNEEQLAPGTPADRGSLPVGTETDAQAPGTPASEESPDPTARPPPGDDG